jgi:hypothetical protein
LDDALYESDETFQVQFDAPVGGAAIGARSASTVTIIDDDGAGGLVQFAGDVSVNESAGIATLTVVRRGATDKTVTVAYTTKDSSAKAGSDYTTTAGLVTFGPGEASKTFTVPILNDTVKEATETFGVNLGTPTGGAVIGSRSWAIVTIVDDD